MHLRENLKDNSGFSLIEVVLAVTILALVTLPIINYFTYSGIQTSKARDRQTATIVAENALDELNSYNNFEQIENIASFGAVSTMEVSGGWTVTPDASADPDELTFTDLEKKDVVMNERNFTVKAHISYEDYLNETGKPLKPKDSTDESEVVGSKFNSYEVPNPSEVYSDENVVAKEDDQVDTALSHFLTNEATYSQPYFTNYTLINNKLQREIQILLEYTDTTKSMFHVKISYLYKLSGAKVDDSEEYEVPLEETIMDKDKLRNIYVFYNLMKDEGSSPPIQKKDYIKLKIGQNGINVEKKDIENLKFYMCSQTTSACQTHDDTQHDITFVNDATLVENQFYYNCEPEKKDPKDTFVRHERKKRIGAIEVKVYEQGDSEPAAVMKTTISE